MMHMLKKRTDRQPHAQARRARWPGAPSATIKQRMDPGSLRRRAAARPQRHRHQGPRLGARTRHHERHPRRRRGDPATTSTRSSPGRSPAPTNGWPPPAAPRPANRSRMSPPAATPNSRTPAPSTISRAAPAPSPASAPTCPTKVLTNADLEKMVDTTDEWITTRTGIKERRIAAQGRVHLRHGAPRPPRRAMKNGRRHGRPDRSHHRRHHHAGHAVSLHGLPGAAEDRRRAGPRRSTWRPPAPASSTRSRSAQQFIMSRTYDTVLVIGAEKLSSIVDWKDRNTCVLFGDGAGAAILQNRPDSHGLLTAVHGRGRRARRNCCCMPGGGSRCPATPESVDARLHYLRMEGKETFKTRRAGDVQRRPGSAAPLRGGHHQDQVRHPAPGQPAHHRRRGRTARAPRRTRCS